MKLNVTFLLCVCGRHTVRETVAEIDSKTNIKGERDTKEMERGNVINCMCVYECVWVCVCVCVRERERE